MPIFKLTLMYSEPFKSDIPDGWASFDITINAPGPEQAERLLKKYISGMFRHTPSGGLQYSLPLTQPYLTYNQSPIASANIAVSSSGVNWIYAPETNTYSGTVSITGTTTAVTTTNATSDTVWYSFNTL